jgi:hypothetical protein
VYANTNAVALAPKITCDASAPRSPPTPARTSSTIALVRRLASNAPPMFAGAELLM